MYGPQENAWEQEYRATRVLSPSNIPHPDVVRFAKWMKKSARAEGARHSFDGSHILDLGSGTGRNAFYFTEQGADVIGYELSDTARTLAERAAKHAELSIKYEKRDIGAPYLLEDASMDFVLDITSSNSLDAQSRSVCLKETHRVLKPGGYLLLRALAKDGDANVKELIAKFPGPESDTYRHPTLDLIERVFSRPDLEATYGKYFTIKMLEKTTHYNAIDGRRYKRNYWVAYLQKPEA